ncbi:hypothetical protein B0H13DRAFT_2176640 [Mycena leptocephala]|nr:hypothetical protein B0H13DRAFT_2176640 [Mycena leptocephala]
MASHQRVWRSQESAAPSDEKLPLGEEIFNALLLITPCSFLLLLMEILIYNQYGQEVNLKTLVGRMTQGVPILSIFVFYTSRHKRDQRVQFLLFLMGTAAGSRMLFLIKRGSYLVNMRQVDISRMCCSHSKLSMNASAPLVTLWVYIVIQLDLGLAVLNLAMVGTFCWWKGLELFK